MGPGAGFALVRLTLLQQLVNIFSSLGLAAVRQWAVVCNRGNESMYEHLQHDIGMTVLISVKH